MKYLVVLALTIAGVVCDYEGGFYARFGIGSSAYLDLPKTEADAQKEGWLETDVPSAVSGLKAYCYTDYVVCVFFEAGYAAGLQAALSATGYTENLYEWAEQGFAKWTAPNGQDYWVTAQYFVDEAYMSQDEETRNSKRDTSKLLQNDGVWVTGNNRELVHVPYSKTDLDSSEFTKQGCFPGMGNHYYYKMTKDLECSAANLFPYFPLEYGKQLVGMGLITYGKLPEASPRDWFERPNKIAVQLIVPNGPDCLYDKANNPGLVTMHVYYIKRPILLNCLF